MDWSNELTMEFLDTYEKESVIWIPKHVLLIEFIVFDFFDLEKRLCPFIIIFFIGLYHVFIR